MRKAECGNLNLFLSVLKVRSTGLLKTEIGDRHHIALFMHYSLEPDMPESMILPLQNNCNTPINFSSKLARSKNTNINNRLCCIQWILLFPVEQVVVYA